MINSMYASKALRYWELSRKWHGHGGIPNLTVGDMMSELKALGRTSPQKLGIMLWDLLDKVIEGDRGPTSLRDDNNIIPLKGTKTGRWPSSQAFGEMHETAKKA